MKDKHVILKIKNLQRRRTCPSWLTTLWYLFVSHQIRFYHQTVPNFYLSVSMTVSSLPVCVCNEMGVEESGWGWNWVFPNRMWSPRGSCKAVILSQAVILSLCFVQLLFFIVDMKSKFLLNGTKILKFFLCQRTVFHYHACR